MPTKTVIGWTDYSSNPLRYRDEGGRDVWACVKVSAGCQHCYSATLAKRWGRGGDFNAGEMTRLTPYLDEREMDRLRTSQAISGKRVFVEDMSDWAGEWVSDALIDQLFTVFAIRQDVCFQLLSKRPERVWAYIVTAAPRIAVILEKASEQGLAWPLPNVWLGTSCENQAAANERLPYLLATPATVRFVSAEPLLGSLDLRAYLGEGGPDGRGAWSGERGLRSGPQWGTGDRLSRQGLADRLPTRQSVDGGEQSVPVPSAASRELDGQLSPGARDDARQALPRPCSSAGVEAFQRPDPRRAHDQSPRRGEDKQPTRESRNGNRIGAVPSRLVRAPSGSDGSTWRAERDGETDRLTGERDSCPAGRRRSLDDDCGTVRRRDADDFKDRPRRAQGGISWLICGGETGPQYRPMHLGWLQDLAAQCDHAAVPLYIKQDSGRLPGRQGRIPDRMWAMKQFPEAVPA